MKKVKITLLLLLFIVNLNAQEYKHEFTAGAGLWSSSELLRDVGSILLTAGLVKYDRTHYGVYHFGYKYSISPKFALGGTFAYEKARSKHTGRWGKYHSNFYTIAPEAYYNYIQKGKITIYILMGIGVTIEDEYNIFNDKKEKIEQWGYPNIQISPVCIKYGNHVGVFGELGVGYKGIICVGLFGRF